MPIPRPPKNGWDSVDEMFEAYRENGWTRTIEFSWISMDPRLGGSIETRFEVRASRLSCSCGGQARFTFVQFRPTGVLVSCGSCRKTMGPIDHDDPCMKILSKRRIPVGEAFKILDATGQYVPPIMKKLRRIDDPLRNLR